MKSPTKKEIISFFLLNTLENLYTLLLTNITIYIIKLSNGLLELLRLELIII